MDLKLQVGNRRELLRLLRRYNKEPDQHAAVTTAIIQRFQRDVAVVVLDVSGSSKVMQRFGIIPFLALMERLELLANVSAEIHHGHVLKVAGDNVFLLFKEVAHAVRGAEAILRGFPPLVALFPENSEVSLTVGVGYGPLLVIGDDDVYGEEVNFACQLSMNLAAPGEVLLTAAARAALGAWEALWEERHFTASGIALTAYRLVVPEG